MFFIFSCIELLTHIDISNYLRIDRRLFRGEPAVFLYSSGNKSNTPAIIAAAANRNMASALRNADVSLVISSPDPCSFMTISMEPAIHIAETMKAVFLLIYIMFSPPKKIILGKNII